MSLCLEERSERGGKDGHGLSESLGLIDLLGYGIGCTVGAGIYSQIAVGVGVAGKVTFCYLGSTKGIFLESVVLPATIKSHRTNFQKF